MQRFRRSRHGQFAAVIVVLVLLLARWQGWLADDKSGVLRPEVDGGLAPGLYDVERVVDGDTLVLRGRRRLRLQGVDTPETVKENTPVQAWGPEAAEFTRSFIREAGRRVRIEVDGEAADQHGRFLAFVWHGDRMLNEELVRAGLAKVRLQYDYSQAKKDRLRRAQREAQQGAQGIWSRR